jgi:phage-related holin
MKRMQDSLFKTVLDALIHMFNDFYAMLSGLALSVLGYFLPVKDIVNLLLLLFIVDVLFGYWAARKLRKERFSVKIIWSHTIPRMLISIILIAGAFLWDTVYNQDVVCTYKVIGWFISGVLLYSIAENGYQITKWSVFPKLAEIIRNKTQQSTGVDIKDEKEAHNGKG